MAFVKTTWVAGRGGGTPFRAAEMNRIEQGIADLYAYGGAPKITNIDLAVGSTSFNVSGLNGDAHRGYDLWMDVQYKDVSAENAPYMRLNPAGDGTNYRCLFRDERMNADGTMTDGGLDNTRSGTGISLGRTINQAAGRNRGLITGRLLCLNPSAGNERVLVNLDAIWRPNMGGTDAQFRRAKINGFITAAVNITSLNFAFDNYAVQGILILRPLVGSF